MWRKSSRCAGNGACIEVKGGTHVTIRDSKFPAMTHIHISRQTFSTLVRFIKEHHHAKR